MTGLKAGSREVLEGEVVKLVVLVAATTGPSMIAERGSYPESIFALSVYHVRWGRLR